MVCRSLARFAKERKAHDIFMCWLDTHEYRSIPTDDYRRSKALHIFHKYIKPGSVLEIGGIDNKERDRINAKIEESKDDASILKTTLFDRVQSICFTEIYSNIFQQFKKTEAFTQLTSTLNTHYNNVRVEDFEYYNKLGEGGFGFVVMAKKKSTGKYYAMKIQTKSGLLDCFSDDPRRADFEKQAFASCQHPFIINLDYAFQTDALAIMVLGLATAGDLQRAQRREPDERLPEERVRFYTAEIVLALGYMHQLGLMYRDLKPNNVLLNEDGHVLLVDLGGVLDQEGKVLGKSNENNLVSPLFAQKFETDIKAIQQQTQAPIDEKERNRKQRRMSIMGTFGYMAPEMVIMLGQTSAEKVGYTNAVDWWSLGVTIFKLLTGYRPFSEDNFNEFMEMVPTINGRRAPTGLPEYSILFQQVPYPNYISNDAVDFISRLLDVNDQTRLGSGPKGLQDIKNHKFFSSIDWALLEQKHVEPPYLPEVKNNGVPEQPLFTSFESMLQEFGKGNWLEDIPREDDQKYFATWYVIDWFYISFLLNLFM